MVVVQQRGYDSESWNGPAFLVRVVELATKERLGLRVNAS